MFWRIKYIICQTTCKLCEWLWKKACGEPTYSELEEENATLFHRCKDLESYVSYLTEGEEEGYIMDGDLF